MFKKVVFLLVLISLISGIFFLITSKKEPASENSTTYVQISPPKPNPSTKPVQKTTAIFVPYWTCADIQQQDMEQYQRVFYFGVSPTINGVNKSEDGYKNIENCKSQIGAKDIYLTVRMTNSEINNAIFSNEKAQDALLLDVTQIAIDNGFKGVAIDLEYGSNFLTDKTPNIKIFIEKFHKALQLSNLPLTLVVYGDNFYRPGGLDLRTVKDDLDEVMIMAYDLHKAGGLPGPNFPLNGKEKFGYDFETMIADFKQIFSPEKISVIFGMYGYDWLVDEGKRPIRPAKSVTVQEVQKKFIESCQWKNCVVRPDPLSAETEINYVDEEANYHIIWYENFQSSKQKGDYLYTQGIGSIAYWAYGYF